MNNSKNDSVIYPLFIIVFLLASFVWYFILVNKYESKLNENSFINEVDIDKIINGGDYYYDHNNGVVVFNENKLFTLNFYKVSGESYVSINYNNYHIPLEQIVKVGVLDDNYIYIEVINDDDKIYFVDTEGVMFESYLNQVADYEIRYDDDEILVPVMNKKGNVQYKKLTINENRKVKVSK